MFIVFFVGITLLSFTYWCLCIVDVGIVVYCIFMLVFLYLDYLICVDTNVGFVVYCVFMLVFFYLVVSFIVNVGISVSVVCGRVPVPMSVSSLRVRAAVHLAYTGATDKQALLYVVVKNLEKVIHSRFIYFYSYIVLYLYIFYVM